jgi:hypothetical protein
MRRTCESKAGRSGASRERGEEEEREDRYFTIVKTFNSASLGTGIDEERSEMRIAEFSKLSNF